MSELRHSQTLKLGLIGTGHWGQRILETVASGEVPGVEISGTCNRSKDWQHFIKQGFDGILIATPPALHCSMVAAALDLKLPIFVEKPLTMNIHEANWLTRYAAGSDVPILVDHVHLFAPGYEALKSDIRAQRWLEAGNCCVSATAGAKGPFRPDCSVLWDWGPHDVAMLLDLIGSMPRVVEAQRSKVCLRTGECGEEVELHLTFSGHIAAKVKLNNVQTPKHRHFVLSPYSGAPEYLQYSQVYGGALTFKNQDFTHEIDQTKPLTQALRVFANAIRGKHDRRLGLRLAVDVVRVLAECERRLQTQEK